MESRVAWPSLLLLWILSTLVAAGPYFALRNGVAWMSDVGLESVALAEGRFQELLNEYYAWVLAVYVCVGGLLSPQWDSEDTGFLGGLLDNPFSWSDDHNRTLRKIALVLLPGKTVWVTVVETGRALLGRWG